MSGVPAAANSAGQSKARPDTVKIAISVQLKEFNSVAELEEKLRPHLLYDLPGAEYTVKLEIPAPDLKRLVEGFFTFPKSQNDKDDYRNRITKYLQSVFGDELTTFVCTNDGSEQQFEGEALVYMTRKQAGENARLAAKFKQVLAATEGDEETRLLLSQFLEGGTAEVLARLKQKAAHEVTAPATAEPRPDRSPELVAAMLKDSILGRLQEKFEKQLQEIELPEGGFTTIEQARAGGSFAKTFYDLNKRRKELGLSLIKKPDRVKDAARLTADYYRHHTKTGEYIPSRPGGRPRKEVQPEAAPAS